MRDQDQVGPGRHGGAPATDSAVRRGRQLVSRAARVLVLTGAGISTDSGIPDFRGPDGLWTRDPAAERRSSIDHYVADPDVRRTVWRQRLRSPLDEARPNVAHHALVDLERRGRLLLLVTQNTDGLHLDAGHHPDRVIEIHGTSRWAMCLRCRARWPMAVVVERVRSGDDDPHCTERTSDGRPCGGIIKSATVSFGQPIDPVDLRRAQAAARTCDLLLAVGTTLAVHPAAGLVPLAASAGSPVVIVNGGPTEMDDVATVVVRGPIGTTLPAVLDPVDGTPAPTADEQPTGDLP